MKITHAKVSSVTTPPLVPAWVGGPDWNATHVALLPPTAYAANQLVPANIDYIQATGGSGSGITLTLQSTLLTVGQFLWVKKVDSGAGAVTVTDANGAVFDGGASYQLVNQYQWAIFIWNGTSFDVFGV